MKSLIRLFLILLPFHLGAQSLQLNIIDTGAGASFRGMSVVDDNTIWVSGSKGTVCRSIDGGRTFAYLSVAGYDSADFRSVFAFDQDRAIISNTGSPAKILVTSDGGQSWKEVYTNEHMAAFIDGIDFWNEKDGIAYGDPIDGRLLVAITNDGGHTWRDLEEESRPQVVEGEASFAASGTAIRCYGDSRVVIASGGVASRLFFSDDRGANWRWVATPIVQGRESTGIFSFHFWNNERGLIIGGDYKNDSLSTDHIFLTNDGGNNWQQPSKPTRGYRECVEYISDKILIAVGPSGMDVSKNGGLTWEPFSDEKKFHVIRKARKGKLTVLAGNGKIALLNY